MQYLNLSKKYKDLNLTLRMNICIMSLNKNQFLLQEWDRESTPLKPKGDAAKFPGKPCEKISGNEKQTIFIQLDVEGNPPPKVEWFKVSIEGIIF